MVYDHLDARGGREWRLSSDHPVSDSTNVVEIGAAIDLLAAVDHLGGQVAWRPEQHPRLGHGCGLVGPDLLRKPEVEHLGEIVEATAVGEKDVRWLHVAMDDASVVRLPQRAAYLAEYEDGPLSQDGTKALYQRL